MKRLIIATAVLALLLAGCSDGNSVGDSGTLEGTDGPGGRPLGETTLPPEVVTTAPPVTEPPDQTPTTRAPQQTAPTRPAANAFEIKIQSDSSAGGAFDPSVAQVFAGSPVKWTNTDSVPRSVEFADQSYQSGPIAPGASVTFTAARAGEFNYEDGTRPYAQGKLRVQSR